MFSFIAGIVSGAIGMIFVMGLVSAGKPTENDIRIERNVAETWKQTAKHFETECIRLRDEERNSRHMAQYWRARCMNTHCEFEAACDGDGNYPVDSDEPTREEKLVSDIMDAVAVAEKEETTVYCNDEKAAVMSA